MTVKAIDRCDSRVRPFFINIYHIWQLSVYERGHCADSEDTFPEIKVRLPSYLCLRTAMPYLNPLKQPGTENKSQPSPNLDRVSGQISVHEIR